MILKCAIIDDEPLAANLLESYVEKTHFFNLMGTYNSAVTAMRDLRVNPVDILFLDIQMPELSGLELAKILPNQTKVIFTTAFSQYSLEGYEVNAIGYLLKPFSYEQFLKVAHKTMQLLEYDKNSNTSTDTNHRFMYIKSEYKLLRIEFDDILYIEGVKDYIKIYLTDGTKVMSLINMKKFEDYLPYPEFIRTHRSYIVHMTKVKTIERLKLVFDDITIPISDSYKDKVQNFIEEHTLA